MINRGCLLSIIISVSLMMTLVSCMKKDEPVPTPTPPIVDVIIPTPTIAPTPSPTPVPTPTPIPTPTPGVMAKMGEAGYIFIENTNVDEVLVIAEDNEYYLTKDAKGKRNYRGALFFDYRNVDPVKRQNLVIYGHNNKDKTKFATLHKYENEKFFKENPNIMLNAFGMMYEYEVVYAGNFDTREYNHIRYVNFKKQDDFIKFVEEGMKRSMHIREGYVPQPDDQMLTLSTCVSQSMKDHDHIRWVIVAKRVSELGPAVNE